MTCGFCLRSCGWQLFLSLAVLLLSGCGVGSGQLMNEQVELHEISAEAQVIVVSSEDGTMRRVALDGSEGVGAEAGGEMSPEEGDLAATRARRPKECGNGPKSGGKLMLEYNQGNARLSLARASGQVIELVRVAGHAGGSNLLEPPIQPYFFSDTCDLVVLGFEGKIWVLEVASQRISPLASGVDAFALSR